MIYLNFIDQNYVHHDTHMEDKLEVSRWKFEEQITSLNLSHFRVLPFCIFSVSLPASLLPENN